MTESLSLQGMFQHADDAREFAAGTTVFTEGTPGDFMYVVLEGEIELSVGGQPLEVARAGDIVGEMALIDSQLRSATALARTDCRLVPVDAKRFQFMVQQTPFFSLHVMRVLADRLRRMNQQGMSIPG